MNSVPIVCSNDLKDTKWEAFSSDFLNEICSVPRCVLSYLTLPPNSLSVVEDFRPKIAPNIGLGIAILGIVATREHSWPSEVFDPRDNLHISPYPNGFLSEACRAPPPLFTPLPTTAITKKLLICCTSYVSATVDHYIIRKRPE